MEMVAAKQDEMSLPWRQTVGSLPAVLQEKQFLLPLCRRLLGQVRHKSSLESFHHRKLLLSMVTGQTLAWNILALAELYSVVVASLSRVSITRRVQRIGRLCVAGCNGNPLEPPVQRSFNGHTVHGLRPVYGTFNGFLTPLCVRLNPTKDGYGVLAPCGNDGHGGFT